jgi:hypothetical protein
MGGSSGMNWSTSFSPLAAMYAMLAVVVATLAGWQIADFAHYDMFKGIVLGFATSTTIVIAVGIAARKLAPYDGLRLFGSYGGVVLKIFATHHNPVWQSIGIAVSLISMAASVMKLFRLLRRPKGGVRTFERR